MPAELICCDCAHIGPAHEFLDPEVPGEHVCPNPECRSRNVEEVLPKPSELAHAESGKASRKKAKKS